MTGSWYSNCPIIRVAMLQANADRSNKIDSLPHPIAPNRHDISHSYKHYLTMQKQTNIEPKIHQKRPAL